MVYTLNNGHSLMADIIGSGCQLTGLIGAFCGATGRSAAKTDVLQATIAAITCWNIAGELAAECANGPGSFQVHLFDELHQLDGAAILNRANVRLLEV